MAWRIAALALILLSVQLPGAHAAHAPVPDLPASTSMPAEHCDHGRAAADGATAGSTAPQMPASDGGCCDGSGCCGAGCAGACATTAALTESIHIQPVLRAAVLQAAPDPGGHAPARPPDPFRPPI